MKGIVAAVAVALVFVGSMRADDKKDDKKIDPAKLVGKWELIKGVEGGLPVGSVVEFAKDGKLTVTVADEAKSQFSGTYKVDGDKFTYKVKVGDAEHEGTDTIKSLSDDKAVFVDGKSGKEEEWTKKK
jgi:uncharacterized protein (TIGR03066 family)